MLLSPPRDVQALFDPPARRQSDAEMLALANGESRRSRSRTSNAAPTNAPVPPGAPGAPPGAPFGASAEQRAAFQRDIIGAERTLRSAIGHSHEDVVLPAVLSAQKAAILDAARRGLITERTAGEHVAALDERFLEVTSGEHPTEH